MVQPVTAILSRTSELANAARCYTHDTNEARLLVGMVVSRAFDAFPDEEADDVIDREMRADLDRMINQLRRAARA